MLANLVVSRMRIDQQQCLSAHHHAGNAVAALGRLFVDEGLLQLVRLALFEQPSSVVILRAPTAAIGRMQEYVARPST